MATAANTELTIRVQAKGGMFLGPDSYNGAIITVSDGSTKLAGPAFMATGNSGTRDSDYVPAATPFPIVTPPTPPASAPTVSWVVASATTVKTIAKFKLTEPKLLTIAACVPLPAAQGDQSAAVDVWVVPGQQPTSVPGIVIEVPGLWVQPELVVLGNTVNLKTKVTMMCGCEVNHDSPWVPADFQVHAHISHDGQKCGDDVPLTFQFNSQFNGELAGLASGDYVAEIIAKQHSTGNYGKACVNFHVD